MASPIVLFFTGPAGVGKSNLSRHVLDHFRNILRRPCKFINLDPYCPGVDCYFDLSQEHGVMEIVNDSTMGPNGSLLRSLEFLETQLHSLDIFEHEDGTIVVVDCPGQLEVYLHLNFLARLHQHFSMAGCVCHNIYLIEGNSITDPSKFLAACTACLSCCSLLSFSQVNLITKVDLLDDFCRMADEEEIEDDAFSHYTNKYSDFFGANFEALIEDLPSKPQFKKLLEVLIQLLESTGLCSFMPMSIHIDSLVRLLCQHILQISNDEYSTFGDSFESNDLDCNQ
jgi:hypothetical protein